jgi:hypothetical protein
MAERQSPYLILGVHFGASKEEAARAFAKATRRVRKKADSPYDLEDLNWALHAIEQRVDDPALSIDDYRMPADPSVYEIPLGEGILNPPIQPYKRCTPPTDAATLEVLGARVRHEVAASLAEQWRSSPLPPLHYFPIPSSPQAS